MSQVQEKKAQTIESAGNENLPAAADGDDFLALASNKVELDLEDAPFLDNAQETKEEQKSDKESKTEIAETNEQEDKVPSKKKKYILIGAGVAFLLIAVLAVFAVPRFFEEEPVLQNVIVVPSQEVRSAPKVFQVAFDPFVLECTDVNGVIRFVKASFILSTSDFDVYHEISNNQKVLRDAIYYYLEIQDAATLLDTTNQQQIKLGLLEAVNKYVVNGKIDDLYIDSFLIF